MKKRDFLKHLSLAGIATTPFFQTLDKLVKSVEGISAEDLASDELFWAQIRAGYRLKPDYINLENGYYCILPQETLENVIHYMRHVNYEGSWYMRTVRFKNKKEISKKLAKLLDCSDEEVIITRNTTESLDTIIGGFDWKEGDEALYATQDYGAMQDMFELQAKRYGIKNNIVSVPNHPRSDSELVELYEKAITPKTRLLMICHMINITGQILPVRKICDMAHSKGVDVMVDGAHAFGHIHFSIQDLGCDYYGSSLHKWLSAPLGSGLLWVKKEKIKDIWQLFGDMNKEEDDIFKLNHTGTHPVHTDLAIGNALEYHYRIGPERKEARLRYLQNYWTDQVRDLPYIVLNTPIERHRSCAIANVGVKGMESLEMAKTLLKKYNIWTVAINRPGVKGCRITPNIYTTTQELDAFVNALKDMGKNISEN